jgi:hypothetical protein
MVAIVGVVEIVALVAFATSYVGDLCRKRKSGGVTSLMS